MGTKVKIKDHDHECGPECRSAKHSTRLEEKELDLATSIPMPKKLAKRLEFMLKKTGTDLDEAKKYLNAGMVFLVFQFVAIFFLPTVFWVVGLVGWAVMHGLYWYHTKDMNRDMGFIDGVLFGQAMFAEGLKEFEDEVLSGDKEVPEEVLEMVKEKKYRRDDDATIKE
jgi:hypothetical protein